MATLRAPNATTRTKKDFLDTALDLLDTALRTFAAVEHERSADFVEGPFAALENKRLEVCLAAAIKAHGAAQFNKKKRDEEDPDTAALRKMNDKTAREKCERELREA
eukprot:jgi/Tetstr1/430382/TSEL_020192.t1